MFGGSCMLEGRGGGFGGGSIESLAGHYRQPLNITSKAKPSHTSPLIAKRITPAKAELLEQFSRH
jgi:hypothetical protein